ncbi:SAGA complex subunit Sgf73 [Sporothrix eucalyptigena]|uniref:SAGA complex subunit Sgf73 n=1 Tax=Sporothrix eucalyptigena TaxID=1812306 RepID=A0ABP0ASG7_9PEZI
MSDARKGPPSSPAPATPAGKKAGVSGTPKVKNDEEATIKVASKKEAKDKDSKDKDAKDSKDGGGSASKSSGIIKLKKPPPKHKQPGNWKEGTFVDQEKKKNAKNASSAIPAPSPSPVVNQLDETARETFATGRPLEDALNLQMCKHCKKSVLATAAKQHIAACLKVKKEKAQRKKEAKEARDRAREQQQRDEEEAQRKAEGGGDKDDDSSDSDDGNDKKAGAATGTPSGKGKKATAAAKKAEAAAAAADAKGGATANKKRKAEAEIEKAAPKKKKKEETKPKTAKPKGPVDVERQCGVILPNGQPCARSLTCKSHSMGAKRAVPGRSLPYDMLLAAYQKKNQAKQQKAAIDASATVEEEEDPNSGNIDSDEETATVMNAMANWRPRPVVQQPSFAPIKRQYQLARLFEQLNTATNGGRVNIFAVRGYGAQRLPDDHPSLADSEDALGEPDVDMLTSMMPPAVPTPVAGARGTSTTPVPPPTVGTSTTPIPVPATPSSSSPPPPPGGIRNHSSPSTAQRPVPVAGRA